MRRIGLLVLLFVVPALAAGPGIVGATGQPQSTHASKTCHKKGKSRNKKCKPAQHRPTATPTPRKKKKPKSTAAPARTATPVPTSTATPTATITSTATLTPTPEPSTARINVESEVARGYTAAFIVCGLPTGVTASFSSNPVTSNLDSSSPTGSSAATRLTLSTGWQVEPGQYGLEIWAQYEDTGGMWSSQPPGGVLDPSAVILTVGNDGQTRVAAASAVPASGFQHCSPLPAAFHPAPTPTPDPNSVKFSASISDVHPMAGETITVTANIAYANQPLPFVPVHIAFYGPRPISPCDITTSYQGSATCSRVNANPLPNQKVIVQATFQYNGRSYTTDTYFLT